MGFQDDYIKAEMLSHERVRAHWREIGDAERFKRKKLMNCAQGANIQACGLCAIRALNASV